MDFQLSHYQSFKAVLNFLENLKESAKAHLTELESFLNHLKTHPECFNKWEDFLFQFENNSMASPDEVLKASIIFCKYYDKKFGFKLENITNIINAVLLGSLHHKTEIMMWNQALKKALNEDFIG